MGGVHTVFRQTKAYNIVRTYSILYLPQKVSCRENNSQDLNGAFPEFFQGLYRGSETNGFDAGIVYKEGTYYLCFWSYKETNATQWYDKPLSSVPADRIVTLETWFQDGYACTRARSSNGTILAKLDVYLIPDAYHAMSTYGCSANREICIAVNPKIKSPAEYEFPAQAYFSMTKFSDSKVTNTAGTVSVFSSSNSTVQYNRADVGMPKNWEDTYDSDHMAVTEAGGYIADVATATFDKEKYPITPLSKSMDIEDKTKVEAPIKSEVSADSTEGMPPTNWHISYEDILAASCDNGGFMSPMTKRWYLSTEDLATFVDLFNEMCANSPQFAIDTRDTVRSYANWLYVDLKGESFSLCCRGIDEVRVMGSGRLVDNGLMKSHKLYEFLQKVNNLAD